MLLATLASSGGQQQNRHMLCSSSNRPTGQAIERNMCGGGQTGEPGHDRRGRAALGAFRKKPPFFSLLIVGGVFYSFGSHPFFPPPPQKGNPGQPLPGGPPGHGVR